MAKTKPKTPRKLDRITIRITPETGRYLRRRASRERRTVTAVLERIIADGLAKAPPAPAEQEDELGILG